MIKDLSTLVKLLKQENSWLEGDGALEISAIESDSRLVKNPGTLFFARKGSTSDGHDYLISLENKADAFVVERRPEGFKTTKPVIVVRDTVEAMAIAAKHFYNDPTKDTRCFAVTGTNGKTTTTFLVQSLCDVLKMPAALTGTVETKFGDYQQPSSLTTPDFTELQKRFSELRSKGAKAFVFEASSHAIDQGRLLGLDLDAALFTNLSPDHLDYHHTMEIYYEAKKRLFSELLLKSPKTQKIAVIPEDGAYGSRLLSDCESYQGVRWLSWSMGISKRKESLSVDSWKTDLTGSEIVVSGLGLKSQLFKTRLVGRFNVANVMGLLTLGLGWGASAADLQRVLDLASAVPGRLERVLDTSIFVDYAHTPDALENVLQTLRPLSEGKLKVVFGCGGDRDRQKRPLMAGIAELYADEIFVTSDNPRTEEPEKIIEDILKGFQGLKPRHVDLDRRRCIQTAVRSLKNIDVLIVAGKGHEDYQIIGTTKIKFDDRDIVRETLSTC